MFTQCIEYVSFLNPHLHLLSTYLSLKISNLKHVAVVNDEDSVGLHVITSNGGRGRYPQLQTPLPCLLWIGDSGKRWQLPVCTWDLLFTKDGIKTVACRYLPNRLKFIYLNTLLRFTMEKSGSIDSLGSKQSSSRQASVDSLSRWGSFN